MMGIRLASQALIETATVRRPETMGGGITMVFTDNPGRSRSVAISVIWRGQEDGSHSSTLTTSPHVPSHRLSLLQTKRRSGI